MRRLLAAHPTGCNLCLGTSQVVAAKKLLVGGGESNPPPEVGKVLFAVAPQNVAESVLPNHLYPLLLRTASGALRVWAGPGAFLVGLGQAPEDLKVSI